VYIPTLFNESDVLDTLFVILTVLLLNGWSKCILSSLPPFPEWFLKSTSCAQTRPPTRVPPSTSCLGSEAGPSCRPVWGLLVTEADHTLLLPCLLPSFLFYSEMRSYDERYSDIVPGCSQPPGLLAFSKPSNSRLSNVISLTERSIPSAFSAPVRGCAQDL
jgi:hypothetical protein